MQDLWPRKGQVPDAEFEAILTRAAEEGAKRALADVGLDGDEAALDIRDLRSLVDCIRLVRRTVMQTAVWTQIAGTNPLERVNREIKQRSDVIGIFPNDDAIVRLVGALMLETNDEWAAARRYMSLETLARVTDNPSVRPPAAPARGSGAAGKVWCCCPEAPDVLLRLVMMMVKDDTPRDQGRARIRPASGNSS